MALHHGDFVKIGEDKGARQPEIEVFIYKLSA
jgi:hypothetical protein